MLDEARQLVDRHAVTSLDGEYQFDASEGRPSRR